MSGLRWLRGAKLRPTYLTFGDAAPLARNLVFLSGLRGLAERIAIAVLSRVGPSRSVEPGALSDAWSEVKAALDASAALLLHTGWYKETLFVGPVRTRDGATLFVKLFAETSAAAAEAERAQAARTVVEPFFRAAAVQRVSGRLVAYDLIEHGRATLDPAQTVAAVAAMAAAALDRATELRPARDAVDLDLLGPRLAAFGLPAVPGFLAEDVAISLAPCHGDCTPWNIFADQAGRACLIDYERAGVDAPFADLFHHRIQPQVVRGRHEAVAPMLDELSRLTGRNRDDMARWLGLYLAGQLQLDLALWLDEGRRHDQLRDLITGKAAMLAEAAAIVEGSAG